MAYNNMKYKDYLGSVEYSANCLYGKVIGINDLVSYEGNSVEELNNAFKNVVDEYIEFCKEQG